VEWRAETADGKTGVIAINKTEYDLADGRLFLVSTVGGKPQVRQLKRDSFGSQQGGEGLRILAKDDPEVRQFVADSAGKK
jgi:hypothetical protein